MLPMLTLATSIAAQGILTWAVPLAVVIVLLVWYVLLLRRRHPE
ncbi:MAG: hypothetical protein QOJ01_1145 [Solirubrobacterales bacterium]|jgi:hypothetical protein|nr:hypothetical protein [Solirubrobacterales bacterium]